ncbi:restriction endonuclease subunit S [Mesorhizobium sp. B292B1B]|uniref:restriction endonuclease subunit S n=1 Tax=unclassified Mesorhizobium TaxID=325217 RepID=UPI0011295652|nr:MULTISPECIES: restriction endonuclease subunit S [unclassified Mesorhizobium]MCA0013406.1 restriction endonuclease subunit S [Mesorhizobium sp. B294B1A1]MCA0039823.1 restriction endonuclease subunit S [Mesorhizobium sp. B292B1B]TPM50382.1 restriction endonuclease subunit S [Mesorhizobium sp. B2-3-2]
MNKFAVKTVEELCADGVLFPPMDGNHGEIHPKSSDYVPTGIPFIMASDLSNGRVDTKNCSFISLEQANRLRKGFSIAGDVLLTHKATIGRRAVVEDLNCPFIMLTPQVTYYRIKNPSVLCSRYLYYYFNSAGFLSLLNQWSDAGSTRAYLGITGQKKLPIVVPPIEWQRWIVELLGALDDKIQLNQQMNETLDAMAQAIFRDWFVDFGPTRRKIEGATDPIETMGGLVTDPDRARRLAKLFPASMSDDGLPDGWKLATVSSVTKMLKRGLTPAYIEEGIPVINQRCIRGRSIDFSFAREHDVERRAPKERLLQMGDVLVNSTGVGTLGRVATVRRLAGPATVDSHVTICRADSSKISPLILSLFLETSEGQIAGMGQGSTGQTELSPSSLGGLALAVASGEVQRSFESAVVPLRQLSSTNGDQNHTLAATRDLLLPKLMSGEIGLREAVQQLEAAQ